MRKYTIPQYLAMALGGGLYVVQTWLLLEHAADGPSKSMALLVAVPIVTATLAFVPVLMEQCWHGRAWGKAFGLILVFLLLAGYSLPQAIGRAGEARDGKIAEASASTASSKRAQDVLALAKDALAQASSDVRAECRTGDGPRCKAMKAIEANRRTDVKTASDALDKLGAPKLAPSDAPRLAAVLRISEETVNLYQPLALPLGLEVGVWILLWIAFSPAMMREVRTSTVQPEPAIIEPMRLDPVVEALLRVQRPMSNGELAHMMQVSKGEASKRVQDAILAGLVRKEKVGREVAVTLS